MLLRSAAATVVLVALPAAAAHGAGAEETALLRRHAPVLHLDARERDHATSVAALAPDLAGDDTVLRRTTRAMPDVAHGRLVRGRDGRRWLQYWLLYADNPQDRGVLRTGRHEGDWEVVQVGLGADGRPELATYAQHSWAQACAWRGPDVFVAHASHASYPTAGTHGRPWPDPDDEAPGDGRVVRPRIEPFGAWSRWPGRWGRTRAGWVPGESSSPRGPAFQPEGPYADPAAFHARARPCAAGAPPHPWPVYAAAALAAALVLALAAAFLRRVSRTLQDGTHDPLQVGYSDRRMPNLWPLAGERGNHVVGANRTVIRVKRRLFPR